MSTSGTTVFDLDLAQLCEEAFERAGGEMRSGYDLRTARRSLNLMFADWANRGLNMWTFEQAEITLLEDTPNYTLPADTVDVLEAVLRTGSGSTERDTPLGRTSLVNYTALANKSAGGRPTLMVMERFITPRLTIWPVPDATVAADYTLVYWRLRRIQDAGNGSNTMDVPFRFVPAMVAGLAYYLITKRPGPLDVERVQLLKQQYDEAWANAETEDRDKSTLRLVPRRGRV